MKAMMLQCVTSLARNKTPLELIALPVPTAADDEILVKVSVCGVCPTELDEIEGRTPPQIPDYTRASDCGARRRLGAKAGKFQFGDRVGIGIGWMHSSCGKCKVCRKVLENLECSGSGL